MLQGSNIVRIIGHGFIIAFVFLFQLITEALSLVFWIIELGKAIGNLLTGQDTRTRASLMIPR